MYLKSKRIAFLGLLTACSVLLIILGGVLEFSTFFFLALASFCVGIAIEEAGIFLGSGLYVATLILGFLLAPNKMYCFTYGALAIYILLIECVLHQIQVKVTEVTRQKHMVLLAKYSIFNLIYLPTLFILPELVYSGEFSPIVYVIAIMAGQVLFYIYDRVYFMFIEYYRRDLKKRLHG